MRSNSASAGVRSFALRTHADDLVQEALLRAWANSEKFQPGTSLRAWLFTILRNAFYSQHRKRLRELLESDGVYSRAIAVAGNQESYLDLADVRRALAKLPVGQRAVVILVAASGVSYEEAALICGVEVGTIKSRVSRGRNQAQRTPGTRPPAEERNRVETQRMRPAGFFERRQYVSPARPPGLRG